MGNPSGAAAIGIGLVILFLLPYLYDQADRRLRILGSRLTFFLGHAGAIFGALYLGTEGVVLSYLGRIWLMVEFIRDPDKRS